jgi:hypothetical protein
MGKGSVPRPFGVPKEQFNNNFDAIFRKNKEQPKEESQKSEEKPKAK